MEIPGEQWVGRRRRDRRLRAYVRHARLAMNVALATATHLSAARRSTRTTRTERRRHQWGKDLLQLVKPTFK